MRKLSVNLTQSANYLIQLFYKTGQRYTCTRTKIGKLLSIVAFSYARNKEQLFNESICKYGDCGTAINELKADVDRDVYLQCEYIDDGEYINAVLDDSVIIPDKHKEISEVSEDVRENIEHVFRIFGSYSAYDLGQFICPIIKVKNMLDENDIVNLSQLSLLQRENFETTENSDKLLNYLFSNTNEEASDDE